VNFRTSGDLHSFCGYSADDGMLINAALGRTATQSTSFFRGQTSANANLAIDGDWETKMMTQDTYGPHWWKLKVMGKPGERLEYIRIHRDTWFSE